MFDAGRLSKLIGSFENQTTEMCNEIMPGEYI